VRWAPSRWPVGPRMVAAPSPRRRIGLCEGRHRKGPHCLQCTFQGLGDGPRTLRSRGTGPGKWSQRSRLRALDGKPRPQLARQRAAFIPCLAPASRHPAPLTPHEHRASARIRRFRPRRRRTRRRGLQAAGAAGARSLPSDAPIRAARRLLVPGTRTSARLGVTGRTT
jgi:hypothetical protein